MIDTSKPTIFRNEIEWVGGSVVFLVGSFFTTMGVCMIVSGERVGWFCAGVFALIPCICLLRLMPNCAYVRVSRTGVELRRSFRSTLFPWDRIVSIEFDCSPPQGFVELVVADSATDEGERIRLPPVYKVMPVILADLLNDWKLAIRNAAACAEN